MPTHHIHSPNPSCLSPLIPSHTQCSYISTLIFFSIYKQDTYCFCPRETPVSIQAEQSTGRSSRPFFSLWRGQFLEADGTGVHKKNWDVMGVRAPCAPTWPANSSPSAQLCKLESSCYEQS